jgi:hypothetical protein
MNRDEFLRILAIGLETSSYHSDSDNSDSDEDNYDKIRELEEVHKWCPEGWCPVGRHETHYCVNTTFNPQGIAYDDSDHSTGEYGAQERGLTERICYASRLALNCICNDGHDHELPLKFVARPNGTFPKNNFTISIILPNLDPKSMKALDMVCK